MPSRTVPSRWIRGNCYFSDVTGPRKRRLILQARLKRARLVRKGSLMMNGTFIVTAMFASVLASVFIGATSGAEPEADDIAKMLPAEPRGFGRPITDRVPWEKLAAHPEYKKVLAKANALLDSPMPETTDSLYLDFSKTGNRTRWQTVARRRRGRLARLALAECIENKGRFLPEIAKTIAAYCAERTWVMPAHDRSLRDFNGKVITVDLGSSSLGLEIAHTRYLLGKRLGEPTRKLIDANLKRRIFDPVLASAAAKGKGNWWMTTTNNWNAVCLCNVTGAALAALDTPAERARFVAIAVEYSKNFLAGFTPDGYCSEGLAYWGYGFGHYVKLSEIVRQNTDGKIDLLARPKAFAPATFPMRIEIANGVSPAFADCGVTTRASWRMMHFIGRTLGLGANPKDDDKLITARGLSESLMFSFPNAATLAADGPGRPDKPGDAQTRRTYFKDAGVLISRPGPGNDACRLAVALKAGHNGEHHNHNDVGSYVVVVGTKPVLADPGSEVYTARTFSSHRYDSKVLNSFGHPVPVVDGHLQKPGRKAEGKVLRADFTDEADTFAIDLSAAYGLAQVRRLERQFVYSPAGAGKLTVTDTVELAKPGTFETALITFGKVTIDDKGVLLIDDSGEAVQATIDTGGAKYDIVQETIQEDLHGHILPKRVGIRLRAPVAKARISVTIVPAPKK